MAKPTQKELNALLHAIDLVQDAANGADDSKRYEDTAKALRSLNKKLLKELKN